MNIYNITRKNEKKETIHKNDLKIVLMKILFFMPSYVIHS